MKRDRVGPSLARATPLASPAVGDSVYLSSGDRLRLVEDAGQGLWRAIRPLLSAVGHHRSGEVVLVDRRDIVRVVSVAEELEALLP